MSDQDWDTADQLAANASVAPAYVPQAAPAMAAPQVQLNPQAAAQIAAIQQSPGQNVPAPQQQLTMTPDQYTGAVIGNLEDRKGITQGQADVNSGGDEKIASLENDTAKEQKDLNQAAAVAHNTASNFANSREYQQRLAVNQLLSHKTDVDPERLWNSKSTGAQVAAGIGIILGGIGGGMTHSGRNIALEQINHQITNDIDAQKDNIEKSFRAIQANQNIDDNAFNRSLHDQEFRNNYRVTALEVFKHKLASAAAETNNQAGQLNAQQAIGDITKQQDDLKLQNWQNHQKLIMQSYAGQAQKRKELMDEYKEAREQAFKLQDPNAANPITEQEANDRIARLHPNLVQYGLWNKPVNPPSATAPTGKVDTEIAQEKRKNELQVETEVDKENREKTVQVPEEKTVVDAYGKPQTVIEMKPRIAVNKDAVPSWNKFIEAYPHVKHSFQEAQKAWNSGDKGRYEQLRQEIIEEAPKLFSYARGPSATQAGETSKSEIDGGTIAGQLPEWPGKLSVLTPGSNFLQPSMGAGIGPKITSSNQAAAKFKSFGETLDSLNESTRNALLTPNVDNSTSSADGSLSTLRPRTATALPNLSSPSTANIDEFKKLYEQYKQTGNL